ncbi:MAG: aminoacyl-tRNA hydrolase [Candidatus Magasanikbacteria bacterium]|nr:aminoacyl-tRNA hydrolase [Candidatus Magasanikbacteria bacterium]
MPYLIPESEISIRFARSSGPGGQNVNKVSSKVTLSWNVRDTKKFSEVQKERILSVLYHRIHVRGNLIISSETGRTQLQNRQFARARLDQLVKHALHIPKKRTATKPSTSSKSKRLDEKKKRSVLKKMRGAIQKGREVF